MDTLADRVRMIRKAQNMTQKEFAAAVGVQRLVVASWEQGAAKPGHARLYVIAEKFGVNIDWLLKGEGLPYKKDLEQAAQNVEDIEVIKRLFSALPPEYQDKIITALRDMIVTGATSPRITTNNVDISGTVNGNVDIKQD